MLTESPRNQVDVTKQTAPISMSDDKSILFSIRPFQKQRGGTDCGLFAIAATTSICYGLDPSTLHFDQHAMRRHMYNCLVKGHKDPFPSRQVDRSEEGKVLIPVSLICVCKMPRRGDYYNVSLVTMFSTLNVLVYYHLCQKALEMCFM